MAIFLPERTATAVDSLTPREVVAELDKYIIGQAKAKRAVAIALRNRIRRQRLPQEMAEEVRQEHPDDRARLASARPKLPAAWRGLRSRPSSRSKPRNLPRSATLDATSNRWFGSRRAVVDMVRAERLEEVQEKANRAGGGTAARSAAATTHRVAMTGDSPAVREQATRTRERFREQLRDHRLDDRVVELDVRDTAMPSFEVIAGSSVEEIGVNLKDMMGNMFQGRTKTRRMKVPEALEYLVADEQAKLVDMESVGRDAVRRVEQAGIIFIDEMDKIASRDAKGGTGHGPDISREGVQRDILPIVEGTTVNTKHGMVRTDHILFIAAGAFHVSKPSDLIPELQGRIPIRVELEPLTRDDFVRILTEPRNALVKQYMALIGTEDVTLSFTPTPSTGSLISPHASTRD